VFLGPFLAFYTVGLLWIQPRWATTTDLWIRWALEPLGLTGALVPTGVVVCTLLGWHLVRRDPWRFPARLLGTMAAETLLLAVPLLGLHGLFQMIGAGCSPWLAVGAAAQAPEGPWLAHIITSMGTGIYEELLFRLLLVSLLIVVARHLVGLKREGGIVAAVLVAAGIFAGAHYFGNATSFTWPTFLFRTAAGIYLSALFAYRGFGIAAAVHFLFNIVIKVAAGAT
jgi:hypothetical protein